MFATRPFRKNEVILTLDDSRVVDARHPLRKGEEPRHCDYLDGGKVILMPSPERHINHSCDPNTYVKTFRGRRRVVALRDIESGDEITYDYCINSGGDTVWTCHCGAARCRQEIHSDFFHLPLEIQREYLPLLDAWFRRERAEDVARLQAKLC